MNGTNEKQAKKMEDKNNSSVQINSEIGTVPSRSEFPHFAFLRKKKDIWYKETLYIHTYIWIFKKIKQALT